jgi:hypothetical protein
MRLKKSFKKIFLFILFAVMFLTFLSLNVSANPNWQVRSLPTIYKITGTIDLDDELKIQLLVGYIKGSGTTSDYIVGVSYCENYNVFTNSLEEGIFIGPINSQVIPSNNKSFPLTLSVQQFNSSGECTTKRDQLTGTVNIGPGFNS